MKTLLIALAASVAIPTAANAQVAKPYAEVTASTQKFDRTRYDLRSDIAYGVRVGLEAPVNSVASITLDGGIENFITNKPTLNANVGLSGRLSGPLSIYGQVGVLQTAGNTGYRLGTGLKLNLHRNAYLRAGYQRDDYGRGAVGNAGTVALGFRF
jgi:opacity protein-like surface antigen